MQTEHSVHSSKWYVKLRLVPYLNLLHIECMYIMVNVTDIFVILVKLPEFNAN